MNSPQGDSILDLPFADAGFSDAFAAAAEIHGYHNLREILHIPLTQLAKKEWLTYEMWEELLKKMDEFPNLHDEIKG